MTTTTATPTTTVCGVPRCDNPTHNQHIACTNCVDGLRRDLRQIPDLLAELEVTLTRQDVTGGEHIPEPPEEARTKDGPPAASTALLFRPIASDVGEYLHDALATWTRHLLEAMRLGEAAAIRPTRTRDDRTRELAAWLERHPDAIATDPEAGALVENIRWAIEDVRRVIFPLQLAYYGPCDDDCGDQLYGPAGADHVRCRSCRRRWIVADRIPLLRERAQGMFLSAEDMSRALPRLAADISIPPLTASQIRGFGHRGRLTQYRPDPRTWSVSADGEPIPPPPRYKVAEVVALMEQLALEEQARQERRALADSAKSRDRIAAAHQRLRDALRASTA